MPTIIDVARRANVSVATVSRVINDYEHVNEETRKRVIKAMKEINYTPNIVARNLKKRTSKLIGFVMADIYNPFFASITKGIETVAYENGYNLILCNSRSDESLEKRQLQILRANQVAGIIISPISDCSAELQELIERKIPIVLVDNLIPGFEVDVIKINNFEGACKATKHLINLKHKEIGIITGPLNETSALERLDGFLETMEANRIKVNHDFIKEGDFQKDSGYTKTMELLLSTPSPTALIVSNNLMTIGALEAIRELGIKIPEEISIIGFDNFIYQKLIALGLTYVSHPEIQIGEKAAELLIKRIEKGKADKPEIINLSPKLILGNSCQRLSTS